MSPLSIWLALTAVPLATVNRVDQPMAPYTLVQMLV